MSNHTNVHLGYKLASLMPPKHLHRDCKEFRLYSTFSEFGKEDYTAAITKIDQAIVQATMSIYQVYYR